MKQVTYWIQLAFLAGLYLSGFDLNLFAQEPNIPIIPEPQQVTFFDAAFRIKSDTKIVLGRGVNELDAFTVNLLNIHIQELTGTPLKIIKEEEGTSTTNIIYFGHLDESALAQKFINNVDISTKIKIGKEGYFLQASDSALVVLANSSQGLFYGGMSLNQLIENKGDQLQVFGVTIYDWPAFPFRGISIDISTGQVPTLENFKRIIRFISQYKMNTLMIYLGNRFRFENLPNIVKDRAALSKTEVAEIETFAKDFHIQIIPIVETLTNMEEILLLPEFRDLAEFPGATSITPLKEESYQLLNEIIFEVAEAFHSPYLHIGGRGRHQIGWHASKNEVEKNGLDFVLVEHYKRIVEIVQKYDKQVLMSADLILSNPALLYQLPRDILFIDTKRQTNESNLVPEVFNRGDRKYMVAPILSNGQSILPNYFTALYTIKNVIKDGFTSGALGAIAANYNEVNGFTFQENNYYGYAFTAECAWSPLSANLDKFNEKYFTQFYGIRTQESELIYSLLMDIAEQATWNEIWQYPFYHTNQTAQKSYKRIYILKNRMQQVLQLIESVSGQSLRHKEHPLDYLKFAAEQSAWLGKKIETVNEIAHFSKRFPEIPTNSEAKEIIDLCYQLVEDLNLIEEKLQLQWLRSYQVEHLPQILDLYGLQIDYWQDIISQIRTGQLFYDPLLESQWIYHPAPQQNNLEQNSSHAFFRKTFDVAPGFKKAYLQAIADSYLKVYLNGGFLGEVIFYESKSLSLESQKVKIWDITSILQPGKNVVAVEAQNYHPDRPAGLNIYGQIEYEFSKNLTFHSDAYWKTSLREEFNWRNLGFYDVQWLNAEPHVKKLTIIKPNFKMARSSKIEWNYLHD